MVYNMGTLSPTFTKPANNITDIGAFLKYSNELSGGIWIIGFTYVLWIIIFAAVVQREGPIKAFGYATFVHFFLTVFLISREYIINTAIIIPLIMLGISGVLLWRYKE